MIIKATLMIHNVNDIMLCQFLLLKNIYATYRKSNIHHTIKGTLLSFWLVHELTMFLHQTECKLNCLHENSAGWLQNFEPNEGWDAADLCYRLCFHIMFLVFICGCLPLHCAAHFVFAGFVRWISSAWQYVEYLSAASILIIYCRQPDTRQVDIQRCEYNCRTRSCKLYWSHAGKQT